MSEKKEKKYIYLGELDSNDEVEKVYDCEKQPKDPSKPQYSHEFLSWSDEEGDIWLKCKLCNLIFSLQH